MDHIKGQTLDLGHPELITFLLAPILKQAATQISREKSQWYDLDVDGQTQCAHIEGQPKATILVAVAVEFYLA